MVVYKAKRSQRKQMCLLLRGTNIKSAPALLVRGSCGYSNENTRASERPNKLHLLSGYRVQRCMSNVDKILQPQTPAMTVGEQALLHQAAPHKPKKTSPFCIHPASQRSLSVFLRHSLVNLALFTLHQMFASFIFIILLRHLQN